AATGIDKHFACAQTAITIAALEQRVTDCHTIGGGAVECFPTNLHVEHPTVGWFSRVIRQSYTSHLRKPSRFVFHLAHPVFKRGKEVSPRQLDEYARISKRQLLQNITTRQHRPGFIEPIAAYPSAVDQSHVSLQCLTQRVGNKIAHSGFARAY